MNRIDIVVPIYNASLFIENFFKAMHDQVFKDFFVIFVDDKSTDDSIEKIRTISAFYPEFCSVTIRRESNGGAGLARDDALNSGLLKSEYVVFLDVDDLPHKDFLLKLYEKAEKDGSDLVACGFQRIDANSGKVIATEMVHNSNEPLENLNSQFAIPYLNTAVWNKIFRRSKIQNVRFGKARIAEDAMFFVKALPFINRVSFINESLYSYYIRNTNRISRSDLAILEESKNQFLQVKDDLKLFPSYEHTLEALVFLRIGIGMTTRAVLTNRKLSKKITRETKEYLNTFFPGWRKNSFLSFGLCFVHGTKTLMVWGCRLLYKMNGFRFFVFCYRTVTTIFHKDVKW